MSDKQTAEEWLESRTGATFQGGGLVAHGDAETYGDMRVAEERERLIPHLQVTLDSVLDTLAVVRPIPEADNE